MEVKYINTNVVSILYRPLCKIAELRLISWYGNSAFPQFFHTMKLGEISVFYALVISVADVFFVKTIF